MNYPENMTYRRKRITPAQATRLLRASERRAAEGAMGALHGKGSVSKTRARQIIGGLIVAQARAQDKRAANRLTDDYSRVLVGARIPRETAAKYHQAAATQGLSVYRWVCDALAAHYATQAAKPPGGAAKAALAPPGSS